MKKSFIKIIALLIALLSAFSLTACFGPVTAYEIAVENGFEGTEEEWLASLQGRDGESGKDGRMLKISQLKTFTLQQKTQGIQKAFYSLLKNIFHQA